MGDPVARASLIPDFHNRYLMSSEGIRLVPDESRFNKKFVLEYINFYLFRNIAIATSTGSTRSRIGLKDLKKLPFIIPPLKEQEKIASILNDWDKAIETQEKLIAEKEALKNGLMQQLLTGKKRLKGFTDEWEEVRLGDIADIKRGGSPRPIKEYITTKSESLNWLKIGDIKKSSKYITSTKEKIICISVITHNPVMLAITSLSNIFSPKYLRFSL